MEHLDEGTVHAWLDGALSEHEGRRIEEHVATCGKCSALVAEARGLIAASSRILSALDEVPRVTSSEQSVPPRNIELKIAPGTATSAPKTAPRKKAWWTRPQFSAAAVLMIVAVSSFVVARNRESAIPESLKAAAENATSAASSPREAPAFALAPSAAPNADSLQPMKPSAAAAQDAASPKTLAKSSARRAPSGLSTPDLAASPEARAVGGLRDARAQSPSDSLKSRSDAKKDVANSAVRAREVSASAQGGANAVVAAPAVAPPPAAAKAILDSTASSLARGEDARMRKAAPASPPARAATDAVAQRADTSARSDQPQKVTRALDPNRRAQIEKERIFDEPKLENVVTTGAASAAASSTLRPADVVGCWSLQRSAAGRVAAIPEHVELTARVVGRENGVEVRAARTLDANSGSTSEWRWMIATHGDVSLIRIVDGLQSAFPLMTSAAHFAAGASRATRQECSVR